MYVCTLRVQSVIFLSVYVHARGIHVDKVCAYVCMHVGIYVCIYVHMYIFMYVCIYIHIEMQRHNALNISNLSNLLRSEYRTSCLRVAG